MGLPSLVAATLARFVTAAWGLACFGEVSERASRGIAFKNVSWMPPIGDLSVNAPSPTPGTAISCLLR